MTHFNARSIRYNRFERYTAFAVDCWTRDRRSMKLLCGLHYRIARPNIFLALEGAVETIVSNCQTAIAAFVGTQSFDEINRSMPSIQDATIGTSRWVKTRFARTLREKFGVVTIGLDVQAPVLEIGAAATMIENVQKNEVEHRRLERMALEDHTRDEQFLGLIKDLGLDNEGREMSPLVKAILLACIFLNRRQ